MKTLVEIRQLPTQEAINYVSSYLNMDFAPNTVLRLKDLKVYCSILGVPASRSKEETRTTLYEVFYALLLDLLEVRRIEKLSADELNNRIDRLVTADQIEAITGQMVGFMNYEYAFWKLTNSGKWDKEKKAFIIRTKASVNMYDLILEAREMLHYKGWL